MSDKKKAKGHESEDLLVVDHVLRVFALLYAPTMKFTVKETVIGDVEYH